jgi:hypothetical protein
MKPKTINYPGLLAVRVPQYQLDYLAQHKKETGNSAGAVVRILIDYYMALETEGKDGSVQQVQS